MDLAELGRHYGTSPNSIKARLACMDVDPDSELTATVWDQLDAIAKHLARGESIRTFKYTPTTAVEIIPTTAAIERVSQEPIVPVDLEALAKIYNFLQNAADKGWHLPTSVVRSITGATPRGTYWKRYGFEFTPATRHGSEKAWAVAQATWDWPIGGGR